MSDDFADSIWAQFVVETQEHLETAEAVILAAEAGSVSTDDVSALFRAMHSLKGMAKALDLLGIEALAHVAEDSLDQVRQGRLSLDSVLCELLFQTVDALKAMSGTSAQTRVDSGPADPQLIERLRQVVASIDGNAPAAEMASAEPDRKNDQIAEQIRDTIQPLADFVNEVSQAALPAEEDYPVIRAQGLHDDAEMMSFFAELMRDNVQPLADFVNHFSEHGLVDEETVNRLKVALGDMAQASCGMGFDYLESVILAIDNDLPENGVVDSARVEAVILQLIGLVDLLSHIETVEQVDAGTAVLTAALRPHLYYRLSSLFAAVSDGYMTLLYTAEAKDETDFDTDLLRQIQDSLAEMYACYAQLLTGSSASILLLLQDVLHALHLTPTSRCVGLLESANDALQLIYRDYSRALGENPQPPDAAELEIAETFVASLGGMLRQLDEARSGRSGHSLDEVLAHWRVSPELAELLTEENGEALIEATQSGSHVYEVTANLEISEEVSMQFLGWVEEHARVITNRTVFRGKQSWYQLLMVSKAPPAELAAQLRQFDPNEQLLELKSKDGTAPVADHHAVTEAVEHSLQQEAALNNAAAADSALLADAPSEEMPVMAPAAEAVEGSAPRAAASAAAREPAQRAAQPAAGDPAATMMRVSGATLDNLMNQIGQMVLVRSQLRHVVSDPEVQLAVTGLKSHLLAQARATGSVVDAEVLAMLETLNEQNRKLTEVDSQLQSALSRLQEGAMDLRVVPFETLFKRFPRVVRDMALAQGKLIRLVMDGNEVRIDKAMVEVLADPLMHMVRNAIDHGIGLPEARKKLGKNPQATILMKVFQQGNRMVVQISDDGRGINVERVKDKAIEKGLLSPDQRDQISNSQVYDFLFAPGFSTTQVVTETSGRGVGMDVVRTNIMRLGGSISVESEYGKGSTFTMELPLSAAVQDAMLVKVGEQTLALPARFVSEVLDMKQVKIQTIKGREAMLLRGAFLPLVTMGDLLGFKSAAEGGEGGRGRAAVVLSNGHHMVGVIVDSMVGRSELFVKDIHPRLAQLPGVGGASILGDGRVVLILEGEAMLRLARSVHGEGTVRSPVSGQRKARGPAGAAASPAAPDEELAA